MKDLALCVDSQNRYWLKQKTSSGIKLENVQDVSGRYNLPPLTVFSKEQDFVAPSSIVQELVDMSLRYDLIHSKDSWLFINKECVERVFVREHRCVCSAEQGFALSKRWAWYISHLQNTRNT